MMFVYNTNESNHKFSFKPKLLIEFVSTAIRKQKKFSAPKPNPLIKLPKKLRKQKAGSSRDSLYKNGSISAMRSPSFSLISKSEHACTASGNAVNIKL
jgi:hypothetical protein